MGEVVFRGKIDGVNAGREPYASNDSNDYHQQSCWYGCGVCDVVKWHFYISCVSISSINAMFNQFTCSHKLPCDTWIAGKAE